MEKERCGNLVLIKQAGAVILSIIASLILINYTAFLFFSRVLLLYEIGFCAYKAITDFGIYMVIGIIVFLIGTLFVVWTRLVLSKQTITNRKLILNAPFAIVRHPMYTGWNVINLGLAGIALHWSVIIPAAIQIIIFYAIMRAEDEENQAVFGSKYSIYRQYVPLTGIIWGTVLYITRSIRIKVE